MSDACVGTERPIKAVHVLLSDDGDSAKLAALNSTGLYTITLALNPGGTKASVAAVLALAIFRQLAR